MIFLFIFNVSLYIPLQLEGDMECDVQCGRLFLGYLIRAVLWWFTAQVSCNNNHRSFKVIFTDVNFPVAQFLKLFWVGVGKQHYFKTVFLYFKIVIENETSLGTKQIPPLSDPHSALFFCSALLQSRRTLLCGVRGGLCYWDVLPLPSLLKSRN